MEQWDEKSGKVSRLKPEYLERNQKKILAAIAKLKEVLVAKLRS
ncbi:MAG TPA: hypothetical protein VJB90_05215 [Candidatus Nanoarchaeia archaeon]|nr:hypothetical protein [Candidatus Nanoarchaeia archaeon]